jgi:hypothetical protein
VEGQGGLNIRTLRRHGQDEIARQESMSLPRGSLKRRCLARLLDLLRQGFKRWSVMNLRVRRGNSLHPFSNLWMMTYDNFDTLPIPSADFVSAPTNSASNTTGKTASFLGGCCCTNAAKVQHSGPGDFGDNA